MRPNANRHGLDVSPEQRQSRLVFDRISRYVGKLAKNPKAGNVHRFRTNSRRVEALISDLTPETGNKNKLLKLLSKLRKKAGKVRDLDVQIAFLKELKVPDRQNHRAQLLQELTEEQARRSKKLAKSFDSDKVLELRKRLRRARTEINLDGIQPLQLAWNRLPKRSQAPLNEKILHAYRIAAKHARYLAELSVDSPEAKVFIQELKRAQDEIGEWHDVLKLKERAEQIFGGVQDSALVSVLQNISQARFRRAVNALLASLTAVSELQQRSYPRLPERKPAVDRSAVARSVAA
jgi:CHAD domain-containing protein